MVMKAFLIPASILTSVSGSFLQRRQIDLQSSLTVDPSVLGANLAQDGLGVTVPNQAASITSTNNFINFCIGKNITNGLQLNDGSCNSVPMGDIPAKGNMPSCKFKEPKNFAVVDKNFDVVVNVTHFGTGTFTNPSTNFLGAPQQLNGAGNILGYISFVIERVISFQSTSITDPARFAFFSNINSVAVDNTVRSSVTPKLPNGLYRIAVMMTTSNHQPIMFPVEQHGPAYDIVYITVEAATSKGVPTVASPPVSSHSPLPSLDSSSSKKNPVVGPAVGGTLGALVILALAVAFAIFLRQRRRQNKLGRLVFPYAPASSQATLEQFTMEPLQQLEAQGVPTNDTALPLIISNATLPIIPSKDRFAAVTRTVPGTSPTPITRSSWSRPNTVHSEAPPPYIE